MDVFKFLTLFGGLAMFLYGMEVMGDGLKNTSGDTLKRVMEKVTQNAFVGMLTGMLITAVIQSSMATIVLAVGLISAGILNLRQAVSIVLGANIGTTVTAQIIRLMDINSSGNMLLEFFKPSTLAPIALIIGVILVMFIRKRGTRCQGQILIGFGIIFVGLLNMTSSVAPLAQSPLFLELLQKFSEVPVLGILTGLVITVIVQSSSATVGMMQALSATGVLTFGLIYPLIMGINLGTCITTAMVCSIGSSKDAKRTGLAHIVFNVIGTVLFMIMMSIIFKVGFLDKLPGKIVNSGDIANFQTFFNLMTAIVLLPFTSLLVKLSKVIIRTDGGEEDYSKLHILDEKLFVSPAIALQQATNAIGRMAELAQKNIEESFRQLLKFSVERSAQMQTREDQLDSFTDTAENFLVKLSKDIENRDDNRQLNMLLQAVSDFERIGDYATNIDKMGARLVDEGIAFSEKAQLELGTIRDAALEIIDNTVRAYKEDNMDLARMVEPLEEVIDDLVAALRDRHIARLKEGKCTISAGLVFIETLTNIGRAADQCSSIAIFLLGRENERIMNNHHEYLRELHTGQDPEYAMEFERKRQQYLKPLNII